YLHGLFQFSYCFCQLFFWRTPVLSRLIRDCFDRLRWYFQLHVGLGRALLPPRGRREHIWLHCIPLEQDCNLYGHSCHTAVQSTPDHLLASSRAATSTLVR